MKSVLAVAFALAIVMLGACLPKISTEIFNHLRHQKIFEQQLHQLQLPVNDNQESGPMSLFEKLAILKNNGQQVFVEEDAMRMEHDRVNECAERYVVQMQADGIFPQFRTKPEINSTPVMIFDITGQRYNLFWNIILDYIDYDEGIEKDLSVCVLIDDETEKVIQLRYMDFRNEDGTALADYHLPVKQMTEAHFTQLGIDNYYLKQEYSSDRVGESEMYGYLRYVLENEKYGDILFVYNYGPTYLSSYIEGTDEEPALEPPAW